MKYIIIFLSAFLISNRVSAQEDAITKYFQKYTQDDRFENVYISKQMLSLFGGSEGNKEDQQLLNILSGLNGLRILTCESATSKQLYDEAGTTMANKGFDNLMTIKDGNEGLTFLTKNGPSGITELLLMSYDGNDFLLLSITGKIDLQKISGLTKGLHLNGMENLQQLEKKSSQKR